MKPVVGGQAVYDGVMLHTQGFTVIAVRRSDGSIGLSVRSEAGRGVLKRWMHVPFLRGIAAIYDSISSGIHGLKVSLELHGKQKRSTLSFLFEVMLGFATAFLLFVVLPHILVDALWKVAIARGSTNAMFLGATHFALNLAEGMMRIAVFICFIASLRILPQMRKYFAYHGAEHKVINAYENGFELSSENAIQQRRLHERCGTSFTLIVFLVSMLLFSLIPWTTFPVRVIGRALLLPVVASVSYELIFVVARSNIPLLKGFIGLGMHLQRLTTNEPSLEQLEVALTALRALLENVNQRSD
ncbi:MAG: hypothetical protein RUDDFDWM_001278 [Candidatus Fervidibacterota bacterium]